MQTRIESLKVKAAGQKDGLEEGQFTAYASVFNEVDSYNEITKPGCFAKSIAAYESKQAPIPVLYGHDQTNPANVIGEVVQAKEDDHGLLVTCQLDIGDDIPNATARQVWGLVKGRRLKSMSIGFIPMSSEIEDTPEGPVRALTEVDLKEVSVVMVPANEAAEIIATKAAEKAAIVMTFEEVALAYLNFKPTVRKSEYTPNRDKQGKEIWLPPLERMTNHIYDNEQELKEYLEKSINSGRGLDIDGANRVAQLVKNVEAERKRKADFEEGIERGKETTEMLKGMTFGVKTYTPGYGPEGVTIPGLEPLERSLAVRASEVRAKAATMAGDLTYRAAGMEQKSFTATGAMTSSLLITPEIDRQPQPAVNVLEVVPFRVVETPSFSYIRQSKRVNNADIVPAGQRKPVSEYGVERVDDELAVIAHIVKGIDKYILQDNAALGDFLATEMVAGVYEKLEGYLVDTLTKVEGIQVQEFKEDRFTSIRSAITKLQANSLEPGAIILNPLDWQEIEVAKADTAGNFIFGSAPVNQIERTLWSTPVVVSHRAKQGEGFVLDVNAAEIAGDGQLEIAWDSSGEAFEMNTFSLRVESRFKPYVRRASGVVQVKLAA